MEFEKIRAIICDQLDLNEDDVAMDSLLEDLGADSLDLVDIVMGIEDEFGMEVPDDAIEKFSTVGDIVDFVEDV